MFNLSANVQIFLIVLSLCWIVSVHYRKNAMDLLFSIQKEDLAQPRVPNLNCFSFLFSCSNGLMCVDDARTCFLVWLDLCDCVQLESQTRHDDPKRADAIDGVPSCKRWTGR